MLRPTEEDRELTHTFLEAPPCASGAKAPPSYGLAASYSTRCHDHLSPCNVQGFFI